MSTNVLRFPPRGRMFDAAKQSLLNADWPVYTRPIDVDLRYGLGPLRHRSRHEAQNNDIAKAFLRLMKVNVLGDHGIGLQSMARTRGGQPARRERQALERAWQRFNRLGHYEVTGAWSGADVDELLLDSAARDGEALLRLVPGWDNEFRFAVQVIDPEQLDVNHNEDLGGNRAVVMGVEIDEWRRPRAYYLRKTPLVAHLSDGVRGDRVRVPAEEIIHAYLPEWVYQTRGVPWMHTALSTLHHTDGYVEAAVVAARKGASAMLFYAQDPDADPMVDTTTGAPQAGALGSGATAAGDLVEEFEPGTAHLLPPGVTPHAVDPTFPNVDHGPFVKALLRWFASGTGVGYNPLANDYEGVNYTSLRAAALTDRDAYKRIQRWFIEHIKQRVFEAWLEQAVMVGAIAGLRPMPEEQRIDQLGDVRWQPRRWDWVDPAKDLQAAAQAVALRTRSISSIIRERGDDPDEVWEELAEDARRLEEIGLTPAQALATMASAAPPPPDGDPPDA